MKKILLFSLGVILLQVVFCLPGYPILRNHQFEVFEIREYSQSEIDDFWLVFDSIYKSDQDLRTKSRDYFQDNFRRVDSINFVKYSNILEKSGYFSFNKNIMDKHIDSTKISDLLLKHYAIQLHFIDLHGLKLMRLIERSIPRKSCNENDLMDFFVTYLFRLTQFETHSFFNIPFKIVLLPDLENSPFSQYYKYAYYKYMEHCRNVNGKFAYFRIANLYIDENLNIDFQNAEIGDAGGILKEFIMKIAHTYRRTIEEIIKQQNPLPILSGKYNVLICTYPRLFMNPPYDF